MKLFKNKYLEISWDMLKKRDYEQAIVYSRKALEKGEESFLPFFIQGLSLFNLQRISESMEIASQGLDKFNNQTDLLAVFGGCLIRYNKISEAEAILLQALKLNENNGLAWAHLSWTYFDQRKYSQSLEAASKALIIQPGDSGAKCNMAGCFKEMRQVEESIKLYKEVIQQNPMVHEAWVGILFTLLFSEKFKVAEHSNIVKKYVETLKNKNLPEFQFAKKKEIRKISIGILSEDIRVHPCAYMLIPFVSNINKKYADVTVYSISKIKDNATLKINKLVNKFVDLSDYDIPTVVNRVREDKLDILIDLGGYTGRSPLRYMVYRLAGIQCSWLGYPASSQMDEIDFRLTDKYANIEAQDKNYSEVLLKNESNLFTYAPLVYRPLSAYEVEYAVQECPFIKNGYITFGSCNNLAKISNTTIKNWCEILLSVPNSKILIEADNLDRMDVSNDLLDTFASYGISKERVFLINRRSENQYLTYNLIDIALDTMPLTGGNTTVDCLWMGVPVITKVGEYFHTRITGAVLNSLSLNEFICETNEEYIKKSVSLACDVEKIKEFRKSIRSIFERSSITNHKKYTDWVLDLFYKKLMPKGDCLQLIDEDGLYFDGVSYSLTDLKRAIVVLFESNEIAKLKVLLENMSAKWPRHWAVAYTLSEIDLIEGKIESSIYKLNIALDLNKNYDRLRKIWHQRVRQDQVDRETPSFRDVIMGDEQ